MRSALAIAGTNLRRVLRDRTATFFIFVFPFMIILAIGAVFGASSTPLLGVSSAGSGPLGADLLTRLERTEGIRVRSYPDRGSLTRAVQRGQVEAGLVIPGGFDREVRGGATVSLPYIARPAGAAQGGSAIVAGVVDEQAAVLRAARFGQRETGSSFDQALARATAASREGPPVAVVERSVGGTAGTFAYGAAQELILFVFVVSLGASSMLIESRRLGVSRRMLASPTSARTIVMGEGLGRFAIALFQGVLIAGVTLVLFGVDWGDPAATAAVVILFALVGTGAAMLAGSVLENAQQAGSFGVFFGLVLAALGGCMVPLEIFPPTMRTIAHLTPHAWALDAFSKILGRGAGIGGVAPQLGALALYAGVLLALATVSFRRRLTG